MKVATLNYHNAYNYGAVFQAAALQQIITELGHDCSIIDYQNPKIANQYNFKPLKLDATLVRNARANLVLLPYIKKKKLNFQKWLDSYKKTSPVDRNTIISLKDVYDRFVVGSDQVWNTKCHGNDQSYFLDFLGDNKKRIAYAASFGSYNIPDSDKKTVEEYIPSFANISVREKRGAEIIKEITGRTVTDTMDPVLLVGKSYWDRRMELVETKEKYIFVYQLGHGHAVSKYAIELKKHTGLKIIYVTVHIDNMLRYSMKDINKSDVSPEMFLCLLSNAEYVVTNSFHATALALLFEKKFSVVIQGDAKATYNSRIFNLLSDYGLQGRIVDAFDSKQYDDNICYDLFKERYPIYKEKSIDYLRNALK